MIAHELPGRRLDARAFLPLLEAGAPSDVVNVASVAGVYSVGGSSGPYAASKHAQLAFSRGVAAELAPRGIRAHAVNPGPVWTEGFPQNRLQGTRYERLVLQPEAVADAILRAVERGKPETFVFGAYRIVGAPPGRDSGDARPSHFTPGPQVALAQRESRSATAAIPAPATASRT